MHVIYILQGALHKKYNTFEHDKGGDEGMWLHGEREHLTDTLEELDM